MHSKAFWSLTFCFEPIHQLVRFHTPPFLFHVPFSLLAHYWNPGILGLMDLSEGNLTGAAAAPVQL